MGVEAEGGKRRAGRGRDGDARGVRLFGAAASLCAVALLSLAVAMAQARLGHATRHRATSATFEPIVLTSARVLVYVRPGSRVGSATAVVQELVAKRWVTRASERAAHARRVVVSFKAPSKPGSLTLRVELRKGRRLIWESGRFVVSIRKRTTLSTPTPTPTPTPTTPTTPTSPTPTAGILPPANPQTICETIPASADTSTVDYCRGLEGVGPITLPSNWSALTVPQQLLVVVNLERVNRGLPPVIGLSASLDSLAQQGAVEDQDPAFPAGYHDPPGTTGAYYDGGGVWWFNSDTAVAADASWMYGDGYGGSNLDCQSPTATACWGHRDILLSNGSSETLVGGAGYVASPNSFAFEELYGYETSDLVFTWASELPYFSTPPAVEPAS